MNLRDELVKKETEQKDLIRNRMVGSQHEQLLTFDKIRSLEREIKVIKKAIEKYRDMSKFTIEGQWQEFLQKCQIKESDLPEFQASEMKKAFFCGSVQLLFLMRDDISRLTEETGCAILDKMVLEVESFLIEEVKKHG